MAAVKRRRLGDLYIRGKMLEPNDGTGEPVKVWMAKLNEIDREAAMRRANAVKARFLIDADDEESETFISMYSEVRELDDREDLVAYVIAEDLSKARRRVEAQRSGDDESWGKDDYFERVSEIDDLDDDLRNYLIEQYDALVVETPEGKDSPPVPTSSTSSESSESTPPSGPETAAA
jgi:hypothetical protein